MNVIRVELMKEEQSWRGNKKDMTGKGRIRNGYMVWLPHSTYMNKDRTGKERSYFFSLRK